MIRIWAGQSRSRRFAEVTFSRFGDANVVLKNTKISRSGYLPFFHDMLRLPRKGTLQQHQQLLCPNIIPTSLHIAPATKSRPAVVVVMW